MNEILKKKLWEEVIIVTFLDVVATEDVLTGSNNDVNLSKLEPYTSNDY